MSCFNSFGQRISNKLRSSRRKGSASAMALVLTIVLLALGVIVGASSVRDHIVQEFGDASVGLDRLDQSYSYSIVIDPDGLNIPVAGATYIDSPTLVDDIDTPPAGITFVAPMGMGDDPEAPVTGPPGTLP